MVATADLHRHHDDKYIAEGRYNLAEWFESELAPSHVDVVLFAGSLKYMRSMLVDLEREAIKSGLEIHW